MTALFAFGCVALYCAVGGVVFGLTAALRSPEPVRLEDLAISVAWPLGLPFGLCAVVAHLLAQLWLDRKK